MQSEETATTVVVTGESRFDRNEAVGDGGVIYVSGTGVSLRLDGDVVFKANVAGRRGGAVFVSEANLATIRDAAFVDNEAERGGGALFAQVDPARCEKHTESHLSIGSEGERSEHRDLKQRLRPKSRQRIRCFWRRNLPPGSGHTLCTDRIGLVHTELGPTRWRRNAHLRPGIDGHPQRDLRWKRGHEWRRCGAVRSGKPLSEIRLH